MTTGANSLMTLYKGWDDYQISLVRAINPLSREQLAWRSAPHLRSAGKIRDLLPWYSIREQLHFS
jgi:hypothetical protein